MNDNRTTELLPCPFCGGEASKRLFYGARYGVYCDECDARVGGLFLTEAEAIAAWNTRAERGTLTAEQVRETVEKHWHDLSADYDMPEATALPEYSYDWQAIADELNARAERTCEIESSFLNDFTSEHECWYEFEMQCGYRFTWDEMEPPRCCPNCGGEIKAVKRDG